MSARILLVEDDPDISTFINALLTVSGYNVTLADNGSEGLKIASNHKFDLIITDVMMPVLDGNQFIKELSKTPNPPPVIVITATPKEVEPTPTIKGTCLKPIAMRQLLELVSKILGNQDPV